MDIEKVNAATTIKIALDRTLSLRKADSLRKDLERIRATMTSEELTEYNKRVAK